eukprot:CAMPEP_0117735330 /NCGR_PEP_ID=MMETSP0947-20121206/1240_1 /TAXON_ID=44440 /ORGANISM="Chattonella subsalsa, Strain CCMP2191" /LENGTH=330 /DNA_ID=CAMNT_0005550349 /DNA_START=68 /DNA_END=1060 /DNA_ORIENTATION=-
MESVNEKLQSPGVSQPSPPNGFYVAGAWTKSGLATTIYIRNQQLKMHLAFDLGFFTEEVLSADKVFISHGHTDHTSAIFQHARGRNCQKRPLTTYYIPAPTVTAFLKMKAAVEELDGGGEIECNLVPVSPGDEIDIGKECIVKVFETQHRVASQGYAVFQRKKKGLKEKYKGLKGQELKDLKASGIEITNVEETVEVVYTGDTTINPLIDLDFVWQAKLLLIEATYLECGNAQEHQKAEQWQHIHLEDILGLWEKVQNEKIVLFHLSAKYQHLNFVSETLSKNVPDEYLEKIFVALQLFGSREPITAMKSIREKVVGRELMALALQTEQA